MGRFKADEAEHYGGQGGTGYFSLKNDQDTAIVRFLYNGVEDVEGYAVHQVEIDGKKRYVNCLREYNQPMDTCPFCAAKMFQSAKLFIPVYNEDEERVQVWERGKKFFAKISSICARYAKAPIVSQTFEIERNGKAGDQTTTYEIYRTDEPADDATLDDYKMPQILGGVILDKTADDMDFFLEEGYFPPEDGEDEAPVRKRPSRASSRREQDEDEEEVPFEEEKKRSNTRRTPASNKKRNNRREAF